MDTQPDITKSKRLPRQVKGGPPLMLSRSVANLVLACCESWLNLKIVQPLTDGTQVLNSQDAKIDQTELGTVVTLPAMTAGSGGSFGGVNYQTANYAALPADDGSLIAFNSGGALTLTLPATPPSPTWFIGVECIGSGGLTISPNGLNLDTAGASLALAQNQGVIIYTDGTNYFTMRGIGGSSGSSAAIWI